MGVVLDLREGEQLGPGEGRVGNAGGCFSKVDLSLCLGEGQGIVEGGVAPVSAHSEPGGGRGNHPGLERREGAGCLDRVWAGGGVFPPAADVSAVMSEVLAHESLVGGSSGPWVYATGIVVPRVVESLVHELVPVTVGVHLRPVVVGWAA